MRDRDKEIMASGLLGGAGLLAVLSGDRRIQGIGVLALVAALGTAVAVDLEDWRNAGLAAFGKVDEQLLALTERADGIEERVTALSERPKRRKKATETPSEAEV